MTPAIDLGQVDLNLLYTFRTVVESGGVGAAARRLGRTQPAISVRLRALERDLSVRLFERVGRRVALTPIGRIVDAEAQEILRGLRALVDQVASEGTEPRGTIRIGTLQTVSVHLLAPVIAAFCRDFAAVRAEIRFGVTRPQVEELIAGSLDAVVSIGPLPRGDLVVRSLGRVRAVAVFSAKTAPRGRGPVSVARLAEHDIMAFGKVADFFFDAVSEYLERHGLDRRVRVRAPHIQALKALVRSGAGASILPDYTVREPGLVARPVAGLSTAQPIWIAVRRASAGVPIVAAFSERLERAMRRRG